MTDKIMEIFEGGRKGGGAGGAFFATGEFEPARLELRFADGARVALPYGHLHEVQYLGSTDGGTEEIRLHFPAFSAVLLVGRQLLPIYEGLLTHLLLWVRQRGEKEDVLGSSICVERIDYFPLTDWEVDREARDQRRIDWLEQRQDATKADEKK